MVFGNNRTTVVDADGVDRPAYDKQNSYQIEQQCPTAEPFGPLHQDDQGLLVVHVTAFAVGGTNMEDILAVAEVVVRHAPHILCIDPFIVDAVHLVRIEKLVGTHII